MQKLLFVGHFLVPLVTFALGKKRPILEELT